MEVRDLQVFLAVATRLNFTRAGEDVHLSQQSVSVRIRQLERELGVKLLEQLGKRVTLTEAGQLLIPDARRVVAALDDARHAIEEFQGLERGTVRIGASTTPGMYLVPKIVARFKGCHPKVEVRLGIKDTREVENVLRAVTEELEHHLGITHTTIQVEGCEPNDMYCIQRAVEHRHPTEHRH